MTGKQMVADLHKAGWRVLASEVVIRRQVRRLWLAPDGSRHKSTERAWKLLPETARTPPAISKRGFASMPAERRRALGAQGSQIAHTKGTAYRWTPDQAREAGRKGGRA